MDRPSPSLLVLGGRGAGFKTFVPANYGRQVAELFLEKEMAAVGEGWQSVNQTSFRLVTLAIRSKSLSAVSRRQSCRMAAAAI